MKRPLSPEEEEFFVFYAPDELVINIVRQGDWALSGPLARTSKNFMKSMTHPEILKEIIHLLERNSCNLFKWLLFAIESRYLYDSPVEYRVTGNPFEKEEKELIIFSQLMKEAEDYLTGSGDILFTGIKLSKMLYLKQSTQGECNCIFLSFNENESIMSFPIDLRGSSIELPEEKRLLSLVESHCVSLEQHGIMNGTHYLTPLALYTQYSKEIISLPNGTTKTWTFGVDEQTGDRFLLEKNEDLWEVLDGDPDYKRKVFSVDFEEGICFMKWRLKIQKYNELFPKFSILYCRPPTKFKSI